MSIGFVQILLIAIHVLPVIPIIGLIKARRHRLAWWSGLAVCLCLIFGLYGYPVYISYVLSTLPS